jgi:hypothetical protein
MDVAAYFDQFPLTDELGSDLIIGVGQLLLLSSKNFPSSTVKHPAPLYTCRF